MEIRRYREEDRGALAKLMVTAFGGSAAHAERYFDPEQNPRLDPDGVFVIEDDGEVRASATVLPMEVFVDGEPAPMGGVAAVMAHPAYRRRRYAGDLMRAALDDMRGRGIHISMLSPFAHAFYRSFGYELATEVVEYALKPTDLPTGPEQSNLRAYRRDDLPAMMALMEAESKEHQVCALRSEAHWRKVLEGDTEATVYEGEGGVEGYLIYELSGWREGREPARRIEAEELVAGTPAARQGLISFLAALDPNAIDVRHWTSRGNPLHPYLRSSFVDAKIEPDQMLRLVDVEGALRLLDRKGGGPLVLEVSDDTVPENAGEYTIGGGEVVRGAEAGDRVSLDVRQIAQLFAGYLPARQLARHGLVEAGSPGALDLLEQLFPVGDPWLFGRDHF